MIRVLEGDIWIQVFLYPDPGNRHPDPHPCGSTAQTEYTGPASAPGGTQVKVGDPGGDHLDPDPKK